MLWIRLHLGLLCSAQLLPVSVKDSFNPQISLWLTLKPNFILFLVIFFWLFEYNQINHYTVCTPKTYLTGGDKYQVTFIFTPMTKCTMSY